LRNEDGDAERSVDAYRTAIQQAPEFAPPYRAMGLFYMKNNEPLQADNYFNQYLELQPDAADRDYIEYYRTSLKAGR
jgi:Tfp pilus assembly protein PilF